MRRSSSMIKDIESTFLEAWLHCREPSSIAWMKAFKHTEVMNDDCSEALQRTPLFSMRFEMQYGCKE